jgi:hypothetical protein
MQCDCKHVHFLKVRGIADINLVWSWDRPRCAGELAGHAGQIAYRSVLPLPIFFSYNCELLNVSFKMRDIPKNRNPLGNPADPSFF